MPTLWFDLDEIDNRQNENYRKHVRRYEYYENPEEDNDDGESMDVICPICGSVVEDGVQCEACGYLVEIYTPKSKRDK